MTSAVAILTYNRLESLKTLVEGLDKHCRNYPRAVFEDKGLRDSTGDEIKKLSKPRHRNELLADEHVGRLTPEGPEYQCFLGQRNLGVAGNSNRALKWFMEETKADHLCLMNDDLIVDGDFVDFYQNAHRRMNVHLFCFCDFTSETYKWIPIKVKAADGTEYELKLLPRMTGIMMSLTRRLVEQIGYFDVNFGHFGEEHCDYTNRARFTGGIRLQTSDMHCLDVHQNPVLLRHQEVESCIPPADKPRHDAVASTQMQKSSRLYVCTSWYRPFLLYMPKFAGAYEAGGIDTSKVCAPELVIQL